MGNNQNWIGLTWVSSSKLGTKQQKYGQSWAIMHRQTMKNVSVGYSYFAFQYSIVGMMIRNKRYVESGCCDVISPHHLNDASLQAWH